MGYTLRLRIDASVSMGLEFEEPEAQEAFRTLMRTMVTSLNWDGPSQTVPQNLSLTLSAADICNGYHDQL